MRFKHPKQNDGGQWQGEERRKSLASGDANTPAVAFTDEKVEEDIRRLQNVPSGEIFKSIGGVLAAHQAGLSLISEITSSNSRRLDELRATVGVANILEANQRGRQLVHASPLNVGKFRKFCRACCAIVRWIINCSRIK